MRKLLSYILMFIMLFTLVSPVNTYARARAEQKIKLTDAIEKTKKTFDINTDNYSFNYSYNENKDGLSTLELHWNSKKNTGNIRASVNTENGDILSYYNFDPSTAKTTNKIPKYSRDMAFDTVVKLLNKMVPAKFSNTLLRDNQAKTYDMTMNTANYNFNFVRQVNGLDFADNGIYISIDKNSLKIKTYRLKWDEASFTDPSNVINPLDAKKIFEDKLGLELSYFIVYDQRAKTETPILVYSLKNGSNPIDAVTGDILSNGYTMTPFDGASEKAKTSSLVSTNPEDQNPPAIQDTYISRDKALEVSRKYIELDEAAKLNSSNLHVNDFDKSATWSFYWDRSDAAKQSYNYMTSTVDALTGKIKSFSMGGTDFYPAKETPVKYTSDEARDIAEKFIGSLEADKFKITELRNRDNEIASKTGKIKDYNFNYAAKINGAFCSFDSFNISVNAYTGKVMNYSMNWKELVLPRVNEAMNLDSAYKSLYKSAKLNLKYLKLYNFDTTKMATSEIKLAYTLDSFSGMLDANTGISLNYAGRPVAAKKNISYSDIKGTSYENDINLLKDMGIISDTNDKYNPNAKILQRDFIMLLIKSLGADYTINESSEMDNSPVYDFYYNIAIKKNIIAEDEKKPEANITRLDAARLIVRTLGTAYLSETGSKFSPSLKDIKLIPENLKTYALVAVGLNIINPINGNFDGAKLLTRGECASIIVNYLNADTNK